MVLPRGSSSNVVKALSSVEKVKSILKSNPQKKFDFVQHASVVDGVLYSAGTRVDGTSF